MNPQLTYNPGTTLNLLHRSKRAYQSNMLKSLALILSLSAVLALYLILFTDGENTVKLDTRSILNLPRQQITVTDTTTTCSNSYSSRGPNKTDFNGSLKGYAIVKDRVTPTVHVPVLTVVPEELQIAAVDFNPVLTGGNIYGADGYDAYQGNGGGSAPEENAVNYEKRTWEPPDHNAQFDLNRKMVIDEWASVKIDKYHQRPGHPRKSHGKFGVAKIGVTIDEKGNIVRMDVIYEQPEEHDFAKALKEWVGEWCYFFPPRVNGEKVGTYITFEHFFGAVEKKSMVVTGPLIVYDKKY